MYLDGHIFLSTLSMGVVQGFVITVKLQAPNTWCLELASFTVSIEIIMAELVKMCENTENRLKLIEMDNSLQM